MKQFLCHQRSNLLSPLVSPMFPIFSAAQGCPCIIMVWKGYGNFSILERLCSSISQLRNCYLLTVLHHIKETFLSDHPGFRLSVTLTPDWDWGPFSTAHPQSYQVSLSAQPQVSLKSLRCPDPSNSLIRGGTQNTELPALHLFLKTSLPWWVRNEGKGHCQHRSWLSLLCPGLRF